MAKKKIKSLNQPRGLFIHPNRKLAPDGSLFLAREAVIDREGIVSKRRGFSRYGTELSNVPTGLFLFDDTLVVLDGTTLKYDSNGAGTWSSWTGTYSPPDASTDMRHLEANKNFYFTTSGGVYVNDAIDGTPRKAGVPAGLDVQVDAGPLMITEATWTRVTTVVTITSTAHGLNEDQYVVIDNSSDLTTIPDGIYRVESTPTANTFTVTGIDTGDASGTLDHSHDFFASYGWQVVTQVGYKVLWRIDDANGNKKRGAPSFRIVSTNTALDDVVWARAGTTITVTSEDHGLVTDFEIVVSDSSDTSAVPNGTYTITSTADADTFTITGIDAGGANGTLDYYRPLQNVITTTLPSDIQAGDFLEVYRTEESAGSTTDPGDRYYLVREYEVTAADVTAGYIQVEDIYDSSALGEGLYTNDTEQGASGANDRPPFAKYLATYDGHTFYAACRREHYFELQLLMV